MFKLAYNGNFESLPITEVFSSFLGERLEKDSRTVYVDADLMALIGVRDLWKKYPDRVLNTGIMEGNMIGVASGLALTGFKPYVHSFAAFVTRRAFDQIFISAAYNKNTMHIIGSEPGIKQDYNGGTHMTFEDVAMMRTIPGAFIFDITDNAMLLSVLNATKDMQGIFYYRLPMSEIRKVYADGSEFRVGKGNILREGKDATIIVSGALVSMALEAAKLLAEEGIQVRVIDMFTIKPLDEPLVIESAKKTGIIITAENASVNGGLGEAVSRCVTENYPVYVKHVAVKEEFGEVGPESYLFERYGFTGTQLAEEVKKAIQLRSQS
ncbi:MAG TPA: transketolase C-terminal domain-containing protein [Lachnospiraceae bacterium]|nr:transketolase C-terminal domain-containing protein [Lachnospiraceae bacterium]